MPKIDHPTKNMICPKLDPKVCDDAIEQVCEQLTEPCLLHKHFMCDGRLDCENKADERHPHCHPYQDSSESAMRLNFGHLKVRLSRATFFGQRGGGGGGGGCWVKMYQKLIT